MMMTTFTYIHIFPASLHAHFLVFPLFLSQIGSENLFFSAKQVKILNFFLYKKKYFSACVKFKNQSYFHYFTEQKLLPYQREDFERKIIFFC